MGAAVETLAYLYVEPVISGYGGHSTDSSGCADDADVVLSPTRDYAIGDDFKSGSINKEIKHLTNITIFSRTLMLNRAKLSVGVVSS